MHIKRMTIILPKRMKDTAQHDTRAIAEALGKALWDNGGRAELIHVPGYGQSGAAVAQRVAAALPKGKGGSGNGR